MNNTVNRYIRGIFLICVILACTLPMGLSPIWNGEIPDHRNQYELMAESLINGHLYLDIEVDPILEAMDNPYNPELRNEYGARESWDTAYYKCHYYMYFGVVPAILVFAPFRLIFGRALTTYHGTQLFVAAFIIGMFFLFEFLKKKFYPSMHEATYLILSAALSVMSIWYSIDAPALYCTAITAALAMMVWSFYFYFRAVYDDFSFNKRIGFATLGALFGALAFGCRPSVALANFVAIPLFIVFLKRYRLERDFWKKIFIILLPYVVVGILLLLYNYVRFENPLEFGQAYQITNTDQHLYGQESHVDISQIKNGIVEALFAKGQLTESLPWVSFAGIFIEFPILWGILLMIYLPVAKLLKRNNMVAVAASFVVVGVIIIVLDTMWSPFLLERYHLDYYFVFAIVDFIIIGAFVKVQEKWSRIVEVMVGVISLVTLVTSVLLFLVPYDLNYTGFYPWVLEKFSF